MLDELLNAQRSTARSVDIQMKANVATPGEESRGDDVSDDVDDWEFEGAVGHDDVERVGVNLRFPGFLKSR